tara:strand:+ start:1462 stop:1848 length:387 start_codon:yes stop_codon:yes gene_type:complete
MEKSLYAKAFNNHLIEFFDDLLIIFPNEKDVSVGKKSCQTIIRMNVTSIVKMWYEYSSPYNEQIENGDISFFLEKDYSSDIKDSNSKTRTEDIITRLRQPIKLLEDTNKEKSMKYIQNLTKLAKVYME